MGLWEHRRRWVLVVLSSVVALLAAGPATASAETGTIPRRMAAVAPVATTAADWQQVARALGRPGVLSADGLVYRVTFPRDDLEITSYGVPLKSGFAVGTSSYAAFSRFPDGTVELMGDLLTTNQEQSPATDTLRAGGIELVGVHKHLADLNLDLWWNHFHGSGSDAGALAATVRKALDRTSTPPAAPCAESGGLNLDIKAVDRALDAGGASECGVHSVLFKRNETVTVHRHVMAPAMGVVTAMFFQPTGGGRAAVSGDFAMTGDEVPAVIKALRAGKIRIVTLHQHSLDDQPRLFYMHFWAVGDAVTLAETLATAVRAHNVSPVIRPTD
jgi:hypothetical protein